MPYTEEGKFVLPVKARLLFHLKKHKGKTEYQLQSELKLDSIGHLNRMLHNLERDSKAKKTNCVHCGVGKVWYLL